MTEEEKKKIKTECWDKCIDTDGYSYIFSKRIEKLEIWLKWSKVLGIIIPVFLGGILASYSSNQNILNIAVFVTSPFALAQLLISTYLTVTGADEAMSLYSSKTAEFMLLHSEFEQLAKFPPPNIEELNQKFNILVEREKGLSKDNYKLKDSELRMGMRYALRNKRRQCAGCNIAPISMKPTDCDVCGNF